MKKYRNINTEVIDDIINFLKILKKENCNITIVPPHIKEIGGDIENVYGTIQTDIHIEYTGLYKKANELLANWEKVRK